MRDWSVEDWPTLAVVTGVGLLCLQVTELVVLATGVVSPPDGFLIGFVTSLVFLGGLLYGSVWVGRSDLPTARYRRIGTWTIAGAGAGISIITAINVSINPVSPFLLLGTFRWSGSLGGVIGLGIGVMEAQAIEQRRTAERLAARQEMLQRERDRLDEFASIISHDLRNPLNVASSRLELARRECESEHHDAIEDALERMETIVEDTLTLARHGQQVGEAEAVALETLARRSWQVISQTDAELQIEDTCTLDADPTRAEHIFENLYRNSVEHSGGSVTVRVGVLSDGDGFYVADDGPGIPPEEREEVFQRGYTNNDGGTGLGLTIVRSIADAHDWTVSVTESESGGARFEFTGVEIH